LSSLANRIERLEREARRVGGRAYRVDGGLPGPSRHAWVNGVLVHAEQGETRVQFETRVLSAVAKGLVVLGGLPPLPGSDTLFGLDQGPPAASYWGDEGE
jgi:hypothetical protein